MKAYLHRNGQTYGPYPEESIRGFLESGHAAPSDLAFEVGAEEWVRLGDLLGMEGEGAQKETQEEALDDQEILEYAEKIKTLVKSEEDEMAIDLVRSLNEPKLYSELLKDCSIEQDSYESYERGDLRLPDWLWNDEEGHDRRPFFLHLIQYCPEDAQIDSSLRRENLTKLTELSLWHCKSLTNVDVLSWCTNLTSLNLYWCSSLMNVDGLSGLTNLVSLRLGRCPSLTNVDCLSGLTSLTDLNLGGFSSLTNMDGLSGCTNLTSLDLTACSSLTNVDCLSGLTNLTEMNLSYCSSLTNVDGLSGLTDLTELNLCSCSSLTEDQVDELRNSLPKCEIRFE